MDEEKRAIEQFKATNTQLIEALQTIRSTESPVGLRAIAIKALSQQPDVSIYQAKDKVIELARKMRSITDAQAMIRDHLIPKLFDAVDNLQRLENEQSASK